MYLLLVSFLFSLNLFIFACAGSSLLCGLSSSCGEQGLLSSCHTWASHCGGSSCCGARALGHMGFGSCGPQALKHRLNSHASRAYLLCGMWDLPRSGIKPMSPTLAGRFFTTKPPGKP